MGLLWVYIRISVQKCLSNLLKLVLVHSFLKKNYVPSLKNDLIDNRSCRALLGPGSLAVPCFE